MNKALKRTLLTILILILLIAVILGGYVIFLNANYYRIQDEKNLNIESNQDVSLQKGSEYTALTYNIGFSAYNHDFSFFMDTGIMKDGTETKGKYSRAQSKTIALDDTNGVIDISEKYDADFILYQEVDLDSTRSHHVDQYQMIVDSFPGYSHTYASNFHSVYLFYPLNEPIGEIESGIATLSKYRLSESVRRSFPVDDNFILKFFDLDRCFTVNRLPVEGEDEKSLVLINTHMSAYDEGGIIRAAQFDMLSNILEDEYAKGNWVIVGGDFNHALGNTYDSHLGDQQIPPWVQPFADDMLPDAFSLVEADNIDDVYTVRATDLPYDNGSHYMTTLDGFIVSDNVEASSANIDAEFKYSDHNPVLLTFKLL